MTAEDGGVARGRGILSLFLFSSYFMSFSLHSTCGVLYTDHDDDPCIAVYVPGS